MLKEICKEKPNSAPRWKSNDGLFDAIWGNEQGTTLKLDGQEYDQANIMDRSTYCASQPALKLTKRKDLFTYEWIKLEAVVPNQVKQRGGIVRDRQGHFHCVLARELSCGL